MGRAASQYSSKPADGPLVQVLRALATLAGLAYLGWRLVYTWDGANLVLFVALLLAEAYGLVRAHVELSLMKRARKPRAEVKGRDRVSVDVVVVAHDEPASEIRAAAVSARAVEGCRQVVLLDRFERPELAQMAERLEILRITGSADADVGSLLNRAVGMGSSPLLVMVPGDIVLMPDIATISAPCFDDPEVGVVLGLTEAANAATDVDYDGYGEQRVRDGLVVPSLAHDHALPWWNGVSVIRRDAIEEIGGFARGDRDVTLATGVRLQVGGWRIDDNGVVIARRLASWSHERHLHRWSRDLKARLDLLRRDDVSWSSTRITPRMRLAYWSPLIEATRGVQRLLLIAVLMATILGFGLPIAAPATVFLGAWTAQMGARLLARWFAMRRVGFRYWIYGDLQLLATELVTAHQVLRGQHEEADLHDPAPGHRSREILHLVIRLALLTGIGSIAIGLREVPYGDFGIVAVIVCTAWVLFSVSQADAGLRLRQLRRTFRASESLDVLGDSDLAVVGVSPFGVDVVSKQRMEVGDRSRVAIALPAADGSVSRFETATIVRRVSKDGGNYVAYLRFSQISDEEMDRVIEYTSVVAGHRAMRADDALRHLAGELVDTGPHPPDDSVADEGAAPIEFGQV